MKRATIAMDDELVQALDQQACERGVSRAEFVREILREKLLPPSETEASAEPTEYETQEDALAAVDAVLGQKPRRILPWAGKYASDGTVGGADIEEHLSRVFARGPRRSS